MARRLVPAEPSAVALALSRREPADMRLLTKHFLAVLEQRAPGNSVEVRVPPWAAVQVIEGVRHKRGTPPAVVGLDPATWVALAVGEETFADAEGDGRVRASGERADRNDRKSAGEGKGV